MIVTNEFHLTISYDGENSLYNDFQLFEAIRKGALEIVGSHTHRISFRHFNNGEYYESSRSKKSC